MTPAAHSLRTTAVARAICALLLGPVAVQAGGGYAAPALPVAPVASVGSGAAANTAPAPFNRDRVLAVLTRAITAHFNLEGELQLDLVRPWTPPAQAATAWDLNVLEYPTAASSTMMVRCRVLADTKSLGDISLVVRAQLWRDAWAIRQPLAAGSPFDAAMLEARRVDLLRDRDVVPAAVGDRSYIFARSVPAGRMLTWHDLARRPLVKKGDMVDVVAADGALSVTMKALATENGAQGDTITIRNPVSRKDFAATVVDENRVQVRF